jgi:glycosyltransferase involved in cell wall biosynthesis
VATEIERRNLTGKVIMLGRHPLEKMPSFFQRADVLLVALKDEPIFAMTIPGKIQTYLATGIPVVAMLNGEGAKLISETGSGMVSSAGDAEGLAQSVSALYQMSPDDRRVMGARGKATYLREFERTMLMDKVEYWLMNLKLKSSR